MYKDVVCVRPKENISQNHKNSINYPWERLEMDLSEFKGHTFPLIIDYFSRWIEITHLQTTTSSFAIENCKSIFARNGIPNNGHQFSSKESMNVVNVFDSSKSFCLFKVAHIIHLKTERLKARNNQKQVSKPYIALFNFLLARSDGVKTDLNLYLCTKNDLHKKSNSSPPKKKTKNKQQFTLENHPTRSEYLPTSSKIQFYLQPCERLNRTSQ